VSITRWDASDAAAGLGEVHRLDLGAAGADREDGGLVDRVGQVEPVKLCQQLVQGSAALAADVPVGHSSQA
jgi:hypothetical protein